MQTDKDKQAERRRKIWELCKGGGDDLACAARLMEAETLAQTHEDWHRIAEKWLKHLGRTGLPDTVRCLHNAFDATNSVGRKLSFRWIWIEVVKQDILYLTEAENYLNAIGSECSDLADYCQCASTWHELPSKDSYVRKYRCLLKAEENAMRDIANYVRAHPEQTEQQVNQYIRSVYFWISFTWFECFDDDLDHGCEFLTRSMNMAKKMMRANAGRLS